MENQNTTYEKDTFVQTHVVKNGFLWTWESDRKSNDSTQCFSGSPSSQLLIGELIMTDYQPLTTSSTSSPDSTGQLQNSWLILLFIHSYRKQMWHDDLPVEKQKEETVRKESSTQQRIYHEYFKHFKEKKLINHLIEILDCRSGWQRVRFKSVHRTAHRVLAVKERVLTGN